MPADNSSPKAINWDEAFVRYADNGETIRTVIDIVGGQPAEIIKSAAAKAVKGLPPAIQEDVAHALQFSLLYLVPGRPEAAKAAKRARKGLSQIAATLAEYPEAAEALKATCRYFQWKGPSLAVVLDATLNRVSLAVEQTHRHHTAMNEWLSPVNQGRQKNAKAEVLILLWESRFKPNEVSQSKAAACFADFLAGVDLGAAGDKESFRQALHNHENRAVKKPRK